MNLVGNGNHEICAGCELGKGSRSSFKDLRSRAKRPLERTHVGIAGPMRASTPEGARYFLVLVDDCTRYLSVALMNRTSDTFTSLQR